MSNNFHSLMEVMSGHIQEVQGLHLYEKVHKIWRGFCKIGAGGLHTMKTYCLRFTKKAIKKIMGKKFLLIYLTIKLLKTSTY